MSRPLRCLKLCAGLLASGATPLITGCSIISPIPLWELAKGTAAMTSAAIPYGASQASQTVYHLHPGFDKVCIEFNPDAPVADVVPALQIELRNHRIESRVYAVDTAATNTLSDLCPVWLKYRADIEWGIPPMRSDYQPFVTSAVLTLRSADGRVLSSSQYELGSGMGLGKWASTQRKLSPVVTALVTGFEN